MKPWELHSHRSIFKRHRIKCLLMDHRSVCFMPSYNLFSQGYPFLEVIYSSLFVCDKMYIFDGSSDETSKILSMLRNERIKIARMEWNFTQRNTLRV